MPNLTQLPRCVRVEDHRRSRDGIGQVLFAVLDAGTARKYSPRLSNRVADLVDIPDMTLC